MNFLVAEPKSTSLVVVGVIAPSVKINCSVDPILKDIPVSATNSKCPSASELIKIAVSLNCIFLFVATVISSPIAVVPDISTLPFISSVVAAIWTSSSATISNWPSALEAK